MRACKACYDIAKGFGTPFISGKDSLYNESPLGPVTPTLLITAIGIINDVRKAVSMELKHPGNPIYLVGQTYPELGGSEYYQMRGFLGKTVPRVRVRQGRKIMDAIRKAIDAGYIKSCHDLSEGGLAVAAAEMAFSSDYGMKLLLENVPGAKEIRRNDFVLFSESNSRFLVEVIEKRREDFETLMRGSVYSAVGRVEKNRNFSVHGLDGKRLIDTSLAELRVCWERALGG